MKLVFNLDDVICTPAKGIKFVVTNYIDIFLGSSWKGATEIIKLFCFSSFLSFTSITIDRLSGIIYYPR